MNLNDKIESRIMNARAKFILVIVSAALLVFATAAVLAAASSPSDARAQTATSSAVTLSAAPNPPVTDDIAVITAALDDESEATTDFQWSVNGAPRTDLSGIGKSVAAFVTPSAPGALRVSVKITRLGETTSTKKDLTLQLQLSEATKAFQNLQNQIEEARLEKARVESEVTITLGYTPENPRPNEIVSLSAGSFQFDIASADITWLFNGRRVASGRGVKSAAVTIGPAGSSNDVSVIVNLTDGRRVEKSVTIVPAAIEFYWWTDSYVPLWYKGKALPAPGTTILIQARPSFADGLSGALVYTWSLNNSAVLPSSGPGKNVFPYTIRSAGGLTDRIAVRVSNISQTINQEAEFRMPAAEAETIIYESEPLSGINSARALDQVIRPAGKTIDVLAEPFYVPRSALGTLRYQWSLNGKTISAEGAKRPYLFTLTSGRDSSGPQDISVSLDDLRNAVIRAARSVRITLE